MVEKPIVIECVDVLLWENPIVSPVKEISSESISGVGIKFGGERDLRYVNLKLPSGHIVK